MDEIVKIAHETAWPIAVVTMFAIFLLNLRSIGDAMRRAPLIRKLKFGGLEVELDRNSLDDLKEKTDKTFLELIRKTDSEVQRFANTASIKSSLRLAGENIKTNLRAESQANLKSAKLRVTVHIFDAVFADHLYQLSNYYYCENSNIFWQSDKGAGRRFSIRYGIIGLAARTEKSQAVGNAFRDTEAREALIENWSMLPEQAAAAGKKPSCLALVLRSPESNEMVGILYADAEEENFFGNMEECLDFAHKCQAMTGVKQLAKALGKLRILTSQIELQFNLTKIGQNI